MPEAPAIDARVHDARRDCSHHSQIHTHIHTHTQVLYEFLPGQYFALLLAVAGAFFYWQLVRAPSQVSERERDESVARLSLLCPCSSPNASACVAGHSLCALVYSPHPNARARRTTQAAAEQERGVQTKQAKADRILKELEREAAASDAAKQAKDRKKVCVRWMRVLSAWRGRQPR